MKSLRTMLAIMLLLPLGAWAGTLADDALANTDSVIPEVGAGTLSPPVQGYQCCWIFILGRWMCVPC